LAQKFGGKGGRSRSAPDECSRTRKKFNLVDMLVSGESVIVIGAGIVGVGSAPF